ncbi:MAG: tetratricopeptide repeat protein [Hyphomonadaceae bacterium]
MIASVQRRLLLLSSAFALVSCASTAPPETPASVYSDYLIGRYADLTREPAAAADRYFNALKVVPKDAVLLDNAVESAVAAGDLDRAAQAARLAQRNGARVELGRLTLGALALRQARYADSRQQLGELMGSSFDRVAARVMIAWALAGEGRTDAAVERLTESADNAPFARLLDGQRSLLLDYAGRTDAALAGYARGERAGVRLPPAVLAHGELLERLGRKDEAIALYADFLENGDEPSIAAALARAKAGGAPPAKSIANPAQGAGIGLYALAGALLGQTDPAYYMPYLTLSLSLDPDLENARLIYSEGLRESGRVDEARATLEKIPETSPAYALAQTRIAWLWRQAGDDDRALAVARAIAAKTNDRMARLTLADLERANERWSEAEKLYDGLLQEASGPGPNDWALLYARGAVRERLGRWPEGEADLKAALKLSPDEPEVLNYLGYAWVDQGVHLEQGLELLQKAVSLEPESGYIVDSLGWAQFKLGDYRGAVETLERAVELMPDDWTLNDHLGDAYWKLKRRAEARFQWERALSQGPAPGEQARIAAKLKEGLPETPPRRARGESASAAARAK